MGEAPTTAPLLDDGRRPGFAPIAIPPSERETDRRPMYIGAGLIALAVTFWWNRRRRERFDREHDDAPPARSKDDDADDLHAAATGATGGDRDANEGTKEDRP